MPRSAPAPNMIAIPGMNPGNIVAGGGGDGGGGGAGSGKKGKGKAGAKASKSKKDAEGGGKNSKACGNGSPGGCNNCGTRMAGGDPVDFSSGATFTQPVADLSLPGPLPFEFARSYDSTSASLDLGLGFGWSHSLAWRLVEARTQLEAYDEHGGLRTYPRLESGQRIEVPDGSRLSLEPDGRYCLEEDDEIRRWFEPSTTEGVFRLVAVVDRNGNTIQLHYDRGLLVSVTDSGGRSISFSHDTSGRIARVAVHDAPLPGQLTTVASYTYDAEGNLIRVTDAEGHSTNFTYDEQHLLTSLTEPGAPTFYFIYDHHQRCIETWGAYPDGSVPGLSPYVSDKLANGKPARGILHVQLDFIDDEYREAADSATIHRIFLNEDGQVEKAGSGESLATREYDDFGNLLGHSDLRGGITTYERDRFGRVLVEVDPLGNRTVTERDERGRAVRISDSLGLILDAHRDPLGNLVELRQSEGEHTLFVRDSRGLVTELVRPDGTRAWREYDAAGNLARLVEADGSAWEFSHDGFGNVVRVVTPNRDVIEHVYDLRGLRLRTRQRDGGVWYFTWTGQRDLASFVDPDGNRTRIEYNGLHSMTRIEHPDGSSLSYEYDRQENLVAVVNELGERRSVQRDADSYAVGVDSFDGRPERYTLNAAGDLMERVDAEGGTTKFTRNIAGQTTDVEYPDGSTVHFEYDLRGRLLRTWGTGALPWETRFDLSSGGLPLRETQTVDGVSHVIERVFDPMRRRVETRTSFGLDVRIQRDVMGRAARMWLSGEATVEFAYDAMGHELRRVLSGEAFVDSLWDPMGRLIRRTVVNPKLEAKVSAGPDWVGEQPPGAIVCKAFQHGPSGDLLERWDSDVAPRSYRYDARHRLLSVLAGLSPMEEFVHDPANNVHERGAPRTYERGNVLRRTAEVDLEWNAEGQLVKKTRRRADGGREEYRYFWSAGRLARVETPRGEEVEFHYDAFDRRLAKRVTRSDTRGDVLSESFTRYVWDDSKVLFERTETVDASGGREETTRHYLFDDAGEAVAERVAPDTDVAIPVAPWSFLVTDANFTPEHMIDAQGNVLGALERGAFGRTRARAGATRSTALRFRGQYEDPETGLHYNHYRYYDPEIGRYVSQDPAGGLPDPNVYRYAVNPIGDSDADGLTHFAKGTWYPNDGSQPVKLGKDGVLDSKIDNGSVSALTATGDYGPKGFNKNNAEHRMHNLTHHRLSDTEQKGLREIDAEAERMLDGAPKGTRDPREGSLVEFEGELPPCKKCRTAMAKWAKKHKAKVEYKYTGKYEGKQKAKPGTFTADFTKGKSDLTWKDSSGKNKLRGKERAELTGGAPAKPGATLGGV